VCSGSDAGDEIEDDDSIGKLDPRFRQDTNVIVYFTLPSGQEEIIIDYNMCFADKQAYLAFKENNCEFGTTIEGGLKQFESQLKLGQVFKGGAAVAAEKQASNEWLAKQLPPIDFEFKLCTLIDFIKKQGYPIENSFVSYYSADFQVQINCGPEPISKAVAISISDLEQNDEGEHTLKLIFSKGIKGDFYDTEANQNKSNFEELSKQEQFAQRNKERSIGFIIEKVA